MNTTPHIVVTDQGFTPEAARPAEMVELSDPAAFDAALQTPQVHSAICIPFGSFSDGRSFTWAKRLRMAGFSGRLRAAGHVIADQYAMARRAGFDEVEISPDLARRQPQEAWVFRADWRAHDYQNRLRGE
jgi:uncharacterized protein (DUF934 family)